MIKLDLHEAAYFDVCKHYKQVYDTPRIQQSAPLMQVELSLSLYFSLLVHF